VVVWWRRRSGGSGVKVLCPSSKKMVLTRCCTLATNEGV
jgi:hypothetical protein